MGTAFDRRRSLARRLSRASGGAIQVQIRFEIAESDFTIVESGLDIAGSEPEIVESDLTIAESEVDLGESRVTLVRSQATFAGSGLENARGEVASSERRLDVVGSEPTLDEGTLGLECSRWATAECLTGKPCSPIGTPLPLRAVPSLRRRYRAGRG